MNLHDTRQDTTVVLRPRSVADLLDLAFPFCARALGPFLALSAALLLPCLALCALVHWRYSANWAGTWVFAVVLGSLVQGAFTMAAGRLMFADRLAVGELLGRFVRRLPAHSISLLGMLFFLVVVSWTVIVLPIAWARLFFVREASLLEGGGPFASLMRSSRFVVGHSLPVIGMLASLLAAQAGFIVVFELLGMGLVEYVLQLGQPFGTLADGGSLYALIGYFVSLPYVASARFLNYIDLRTRKEGWDIALRFRAIVAADEERNGLRVSSPLEEDAA